MTAYELRITLLDTKPPVWRRFAVPGEITLDRLHDVIQIVLGWQDRHLHAFDIDGKRFTEGPEEKEDGQAEKGHRLCDLVTRAKAKFAYEYDFGDDWQHTVVVERITKVPEGHEAILGCLGGKRRCPPEDVGGTGGYDDFLNTIADRKHPIHKELLRWCGGKFDPDEFDDDAVNLELLKYIRWSRPR